MPIVWLKAMKKTCATCKFLLYFPPFVQKEINLDDAFHCAKDIWRGEDDPAVFLEPVKCELFERRKEEEPYFEKHTESFQPKTSLVRIKVKSTIKRTKVKLVRTQLKRTKHEQVLKRTR